MTDIALAAAVVEIYSMCVCVCACFDIELYYWVYCINLWAFKLILTILSYDGNVDWLNK